MKLMIAIVQDEDTSRLISALMSEGIGVTKLATTGGFLRAGNTTLLIGVDDQAVDSTMKVIEGACRSRKQVTTVSSSVNDPVGIASNGYPVQVTVGGATVFVLNVEQFAKL